MAKTQTIQFGEFMTGEYKVRKADKTKQTVKTITKLALSSSLPLLVSSGSLSALVIPAHAFAQGTSGSVVSDNAVRMLAHAFDPLVQILVAVSLPVASVVMVGGCFFFMFGNSEKAWSMIQNAGLGYVLIQLSPMFIKILESVGRSL